MSRFEIRKFDEVLCIHDAAHRELVRTPAGKIFATLDPDEAAQALEQLQEDDRGG